MRISSDKIRGELLYIEQKRKYGAEHVNKLKIQELMGM